ncbi:MAG: tail fiber domain-containing protein [Nanoarchaeota archaeon]|nr:tail fiber domain-containing protein [Nanoarchaeota archaeon]
MDNKKTLQIWIIGLFVLVGALVPSVLAIDNFNISSSISSSPLFLVNGTTGNALFNYNVTADYFVGDGSRLTNLNVSALNLSDYVPYTGSDKNVVFGDYNFSIGTTDFFVNSNTGNVGIGTTSPATKLHVSGELTLNAGQSINFNGVAGSGSQPGTYYNSVDNVMYLYSGVVGSKTYIGSDTGGTVLASNGASILTAIDGNVGIGTTTPGAPLEVYTSASGADTTGGGLIFSRIDSSNYRASSIFHRYITGVGGEAMVFAVGAAGANPYPVGTAAMTYAKMVITEGGNIGIGTTGPGVPLEVNGAIANKEGSDFIILDNVAGDSYVSWGASGSSRSLIFGTVATYPGTGWSEKMRIQNDGNVGIGTTAPGAKLHIDNGATTGLAQEVLRIESVDTSGTSAGIKFYADDSVTGGIFGGRIDATQRTIDFQHLDAQPATNQAFRWFTTVTGPTLAEKMTMLVNGNVGIGTTAPTYKIYGAGSDYGIKTMIVSGVDDDGLIIGNSLAGGSNLFGFSQLNAGSEQVLTSAIIGEMTDTTDGLEKGIMSFHTKTAGGYITEQMRITDTGNVGIGTTAPNQKLSVSKSSAGATVTGLELLNPNANANTGANILFNFNGAGGADTFATISAVRTNSPADGDTYLAFSTRGTSVQERLRISETGNVGIGTTGPSTKLHVNGANVGSIGLLYINSSDSAYLGLNSATDGDSGIYFRENAITKWEVYNDGNDGDKLKFLDDGDVRMTIQQDGNVGIGTTGPEAKLEVYGGYFRTSDDGTNYAYAQSTGGIAYFGATGNGRVALGNGENYETVTIDGGNVGIGTTSPDTIFEIEKTDTTATLTNAPNFLKISNPSVAIDRFAGINFAHYGGNYPLGFVGTRTTSVTGYGYADMVFAVKNGTTNIPPVEVMTITAPNGNVGIGTTGPGAKLDIRTNSTNHLEWGNTAYPVGRLTVSGNDAQIYSQLNGGLSLGSNGSADKLYIDTSGRVGIGTTAPGSKLTIGNNFATGYLDSFSEYQLLLYSEANPSDSYGIGVKNGSMVFNSGGDYSFDVIGSVTSMFISGSGTGVGIGTTAPQNNLDVEGGAVIGATYSGTNTAPSNGLLVQGDVGIGTTNPGYNLEVTGYIYASEDVCSGASASCMADFSDSRLKNITSNFSGSLEKLKDLKVVEFKWNDKAKELRPFYNNKTNFGLIAQEVEKVFPELVVNGTDGYLRLNYEDFSPILIQAINELNEKTSSSILDLSKDTLKINGEIKDLKIENSKMRVENIELKNKNNELNKTVTNLNSLVDKICSNNPGLCV